MKKVAEVCSDTGLSKSDVLLEIDFVPDESGSAPALKYPPEFKVKDTHGYIEGSRPNEPDWFGKSEDVNEYNKVKSLVAGLREQHERMTENNLLCYVRHTDGFMAYYRLHIAASHRLWFEGRKEVQL